MHIPTHWLTSLSFVSAQQHRSSAASVNAPSGIAQLRKTSEQNLPQPESMDLEDFLVADNVATTAAVISQENLRQAEERSTHSVTPAIPIKSRKEASQHFNIPQSVPVPAHRQRAQDEFGYVTRHPRKTSIDDRRVGAHMLLALLTGLPQANAALSRDGLLMSGNVDSEAPGRLFASCVGC